MNIVLEGNSWHLAHTVKSVISKRDYLFIISCLFIERGVDISVFTWLNISISQILYDTQDKTRKNHLGHQEKVSGY